MTRKEQIVQTCMDIFTESGTDGLTMKAIAERVRISEPAIYRHFENKEAVIIAMVVHIRDEIFRYVDEIAAQSLNAVEKLHRIFEHHLYYLKEKRAITLELLSESFFHHHPGVRRHMLLLLEGYHRKIQDIMTAGLEKGEIPERVPPRAASILFLGGMQHLLTMFKLTNDEKEIDAVAEDVFGLFKKALKGRSES